MFTDLPEAKTQSDQHEHNGVVSPVPRSHCAICQREAATVIVKDLIQYINLTPGLLSLLYDLDLLPEQLNEGSADWKRMLTVASFYRSIPDPAVQLLAATYEEVK